MPPHSDMSEPGKQYAFYMHHSTLRGFVYVTRPGTYRAVVLLALPPGKYAAEWLDPELGLVISRETLVHYAGTAAFPTPPYTVDIALRLKRVVPQQM